MIVKLDVFAQLKGDDIIDPRMVQRFCSKALGEYLSVRFGKSGTDRIEFTPVEFEFLKQLGIKSDKVIILTEEQAFSKLK
jgi:hypothetical protein